LPHGTVRPLVLIRNSGADIVSIGKLPKNLSYRPLIRTRSAGLSLYQKKIKFGFLIQLVT
jgi:hypothetical protein